MRCHCRHVLGQSCSTHTSVWIMCIDAHHMPTLNPLKDSRRHLLHHCRGCRDYCRHGNQVREADPRGCRCPDRPGRQHSAGQDGQQGVYARRWAIALHISVSRAATQCRSRWAARGACVPLCTTLASAIAILNYCVDSFSLDCRYIYGEVIRQEPLSVLRIVGSATGSSLRYLLKQIP